MHRSVPLGVLIASVISAQAVASLLFVPGQYADVPSAMAAAQSGDIIRIDLTGAGGQTAGIYGFNFGRGVDFAGRAISLDFSTGSSITTDRTAIITLANSASVQLDSVLQWQGTVVVPAGASASFSSTQSINSEGSSAQLILGTGATLNLVAQSHNFGGVIRLGSGAALYTQTTVGSSFGSASIFAEAGSTLAWSNSFTLSGSLTSLAGMVQSGPTFTASGPVSVINGAWIGSTIIDSNATMNLSNTTVVARSLQVSGTSGRLTGSGQWFTDVTVGLGSQATFLANSTVTGAYRNDGRTVVQNGTLVIAGSLTNTGQLVGNIMGPRGPGSNPPSLSISGDYSSGPEASLLFPGASIRVTGDFDPETTDGTRCDLRSSSVQIGGSGGSSDLEALSEDVGASTAAFIRATTAFPIGTLTLAGLVSLVDNHPNAAPGPDALYVLDLRIPAGASLHTGGRRIYYRTLTLAGQVDDPANLVPVTFCAADFDASGAVTLQDLFDFLVAYFNSDPRADINHVGGVTVQDVFDYLVAYLSGCP